MTIKNRILNYFDEGGVHSCKDIMVTLDYRKRAIIDKYLSELVKKDKKIYRISRGRYSKVNQLNDYDTERIRNKNLRDKYPKLVNILHCAKQRCTNPNHPNFKQYGLKGVKVLISLADLVEVWHRDKGWEFKRPSVDRIDSNGSYTKDNIRFIELSENVSRAHKKEKGK